MKKKEGLRVAPVAAAEIPGNEERAQATSKVTTLGERDMSSSLKQTTLDSFVLHY